MAPDSASNHIGAWDPQDMAATARDSAGVGADSGLPTEARFQVNVTKALRRRNSNPASGTDPAIPAVFLLEQECPPTVFQAISRVPILNNGVAALNGKIWFVSPAANSGRCLSVAFPDDAGLFDYVNRDLGMGTAPAIVYDPRSIPREIRFYGKGLHFPDECTSKSADAERVTAAEIFDVVQRVYDGCLVTPDANSRAALLWEKPDRCWPCNNTEATIQSALKVALFVEFRSCAIREEQATETGRTDIEIEEYDFSTPGTCIHHALLELKVLRSFTYFGTPLSESDARRAVTKGLCQAFVYGRTKNAILKSLCCFDMRQSDDHEACFNDIRDRAKHRSVELRRWYIYSSSERYRQVITAL